MKQIYLFSDHDPTTWANGWEPEFERMSDRDSFYSSDFDHVKIKTNSQKISDFSAVNLIISSSHTQAIKLARTFSKEIRLDRIENGFIDAHIHAHTLIPDKVDQGVLIMNYKSVSMISLLHRSIEKLPEDTNVVLIADPRTVQLMVSNFLSLDKINLKFNTSLCPGIKITLNAQRQKRDVRALQPFVLEPELV